jgi:hypothetical protein
MYSNTNFSEVQTLTRQCALSVHTYNTHYKANKVIVIWLYVYFLWLTPQNQQAKMIVKSLTKICFGLLYIDIRTKLLTTLLVSKRG